MNTDDDITPAQVYRETGRWFGPVLIAGLAILAICLVLGLVGWQAGWWFTAQNATRQAEVTQNGYSNQVTLRQQITARLADVTSITVQIATADKSAIPALKAQRASIANIVCADAGQVTGTPLPAQQAQWASANCSAGSVSPSSPLYVTGAS
jgi:hypothetical protein